MKPVSVKETQLVLRAPEVRGILDGRKTMTRRVVKNVAAIWDGSKPKRERWVPTGGKGPFVEKDGKLYVIDGEGDLDQAVDFAPYQPGDLLWVRETFCPDFHDEVLYRATTKGTAKEAGFSAEPKWKPSIFMPRWASRITLEVLDVKVERLQDISEEDAKAEGVEPLAKAYLGLPAKGYREAFTELWQSLNAKRFPWQSNPWCWALTFKRVKS